MNRFTIIKQDDPQESAFGLVDPFPAPDAAILLNELMLRRRHHTRDPFQSNRRAIRSLARQKKILRVFHVVSLVSIRSNSQSIACPKKLPLPPHATQRFEGVDDLRQAFFPRAFAGEAGGEVGFGKGDRRGGEDAGDGGDLFG